MTNKNEFDEKIQGEQPIFLDDNEGVMRPEELKEWSSSIFCNRGLIDQNLDDADK